MTRQGVALRDLVPVAAEEAKRCSLTAECEVLRDLDGLVDDLIVEQWGGPDFLDLLRQLGATVAPGEDREQG